MKQTNFLAAIIIALVISGCSSTNVKEEPLSAPAPQGEQTSTSPPVDPSPMNKTDSNEVPEVEKPTIADNASPIIENTDNVAADVAVSTSDAETEYSCEHNNVKRIIRVVHNSSADFACTVEYEKPTGRKTLWTAINDKAFCADKAVMFAKKQVAWGWKCIDKKGTLITN